MSPKKIGDFFYFQKSVILLSLKNWKLFLFSRKCSVFVIKILNPLC